ncbi:MAG: cache domain-containing protein [Anaerolineae bacterium]
MTATSPPSRLRTRIVMWSFMPTTAILVAVAATILFSYQKVTEDLVVGRNQQLTRLSARQLASDLATYAADLTTLAHTAQITSGVPSRQSAALSAASSQLLAFDGGAVVLDTEGLVVATDPTAIRLLGQDWSEQTFFRQLIRGVEPAYSDVLTQGSDGAIGVGVAVPVRSPQGTLQGALVGLFRLGPESSGALYGTVVKLRPGATGSAYLVDSAGRLLYHPDNSLIGQEISSQPAVQQVAGRRVDYLRTAGLDGKEVLTSFAPVPGTPWGLVQEEAWESLMGATRTYGQFLLVLLGLGVLVPAAVVTLGVGRVTRPVGQLLEGARRIANGQYGQTITLSTGDELEDLVAQFNRMSLSLEESYAQLEARVATRTRELAALNTIAAVASKSLYLEETLTATLRETLQTVGMEAGAAFCLEEVKGTPRLRLVARQGLSDGWPQSLGRLTMTGGTFLQVSQSQQPLVRLRDEHPEPELRALLEREGVAQVVYVPLLTKGELVGVLALGARQARPIGEDGRRLLAAIGQQIGVAVENAHLYDQARESATLAERSRLARELHDSVTQSLYSVTLFAEASATLLAAGQHATAAEHLNELRDTAQEALREMRLLIFQLRPPALEHEGLSALLHERLQAVEARGGMESSLEVSGEETLPLDVQEELYHIAQEILNNVLKHAHARRVHVRLEYRPEGASLSIEDDGEGFDPARVHRGGMGLQGLRERAARIGAELSLDSAPGHGTRVRVDVPVRPGTERSGGADDGGFGAATYL